VNSTREHFQEAARHHESAAYHYEEVMKYDAGEEHKKGRTTHTWAPGHSQHAIDHDAAAAKLLVDGCASLSTWLFKKKRVA
jgi:hypothetical protein